MKKILISGSFICLSAILFSCNQAEKKAETASGSTTEDSTTTSPVDKPMMVSPVKDSEEFPNAELAVTSIASEKISADSAKLTVNYAVKNYELTRQTKDSNADHCNNSEKGQHIHFIMDNKPYVALYEPKNSTNLALNSEHYLMSFLSRSYHESVKNPKAAVLEHFKIDANGKYIKLDVGKEPMIFYSRPKGAYKEKDTEKVLLDFYVYNTNITDKSNKVKVMVNYSTFTLDNWQPYFIENAKAGDMNVTLQLIDKDGKDLAGKNASATGKASLMK